MDSIWTFSNSLTFSGKFPLFFYLFLFSKSFFRINIIFFLLQLSLVDFWMILIHILFRKLNWPIIKFNIFSLIKTKRKLIVKIILLQISILSTVLFWKNYLFWNFKIFLQIQEFFFMYHTENNKKIYISNIFV